MKKIIWVLIVVAVAGYFFNSYTENKARRDTKRAELEKIEQTTRAAVSQMAARTNAIKSWEETLNKGERFRLGPVLTIELERVWVQERPILFAGAIKDIATHDESQYLILVERSLYGNYEYEFDTELHLSLISSKEKIDSFLEEHTELFKDYGFSNGVAVVARINSIRTIYVPGEEGGHDEIKIGEGELVDITYTGDI